jgi:hypothetical protein
MDEVVEDEEDLHQVMIRRLLLIIHEINNKNILVQS